MSAPSTIFELPLEKLVPFQTAEIGFRPYPPDQLEALSQQLQEDGLMFRSDQAASRSTATNLGFDRKRFIPYLQQFHSDAEIEDLFLAFLKEYCP